jgi:hypothetical protein
MPPPAPVGQLLVGKAVSMNFLNRDRVGSAIVILFCLSAWTLTNDMPADAAFFPNIILGLAFVLSVIWCVSSYLPVGRRAAREVVEDTPPTNAEPFFKNRRNFLIFFGCIVAYALLIDLGGYFTASALFVAGSSLLLGYRRPVITVATAAGFVVFMYVLIVVVLERPLPVEFFVAG